LKGLTLLCKVEPFNKFNTPRVSQLTQRSNQFNLRTTRYSEKQIDEISLSKSNVCLSFSLEDKFGQHGLIAVVILEKRDSSEVFIETWLMSCRVLRRSMEAFVLNYIVDLATNLGFKKIIGEYIPTPKNGIVANHYLDLGFVKQDSLWELELKNFKKSVTFIKEAK
jgi:FkbH-like protein